MNKTLKLSNSLNKSIISKYNTNILSNNTSNDDMNRKLNFGFSPDLNDLNKST